MSTLHDFALDLFSNPTSRLEFLQDPAGVLTEAGLGDITGDDVYEILPLVLDSVPASHGLEGLLEVGDVTGIEQLQVIAQNIDGVTSATDVVTDVAAVGSVTALVKDFSDIGDVSSTIDAVVLKGIDTDVTTKVTDVVHDNEVVAKVVQGNEVLAKVTDVADLEVEDVLNNPVTKIDVVDDIDATIKDVDVIDAGDTVVQDVVGDVQVGDVLTGIAVGDVLDGGILNGNDNDVDIHF